MAFALTPINTVEDLEVLARLVDAGEIVAFETDTVPALAGQAFNPAVRTKLSLLKGRSEAQKLQVLVDGNTLQKRILPQIHPSARAAFSGLAERFFPGALTVVAPTIGLDDGSVGIRYPSDAHVQALLQQTGPLWATSANKSCQLPAQSLAEVYALFGDTIYYYNTRRSSAAREDAGDTACESDAGAIKNARSAENEHDTAVRGDVRSAENIASTVVRIRLDEVRQFEFAGIEFLRVGSVGKAEVLSALKDGFSGFGGQLF